MRTGGSDSASPQISVVIPTRNRHDSLFRTLASLADQSHPIDEVIIVDSSDEKENETALKDAFPSLRLDYLISPPSVCVQRNLGIGRARSSYVFLCDDDVSLSPDYLSALASWIGDERGAVSGLFIDPGQTAENATQYPITSVLELSFRWFFRLPVCFDLKGLEKPGPIGAFLNLLKRWYLKRGNGLTGAGWPVTIDFSGPVFRVRVWSLMACLVRKDWLTPYDEILDPNGIGDNYGVALRMPGPVTVVREALLIHHKSPENRLARHVAYSKRILALHYFLVTLPGFSILNRIWLVWSLSGNLAGQLLRRDWNWARATAGALARILSGRNPYLRRVEKQG